MGSELSPNTGRRFDRFCRQFLQINLELDYPDPDLLRQDAIQRAIFKELFQDGALEHSPPPRYQVRVLKELIRRIEASIQDWEEDGISDDLMSHLAILISSPMPSEATSAQTKSYVTYTLSSLSANLINIPTITLLEARNLVSAAGTTGLRTWEAALHLGNYLCANRSIIRSKSVLELGAGTGFVSVLCSKHLQASHVLATDGSDDVVAGLSTNFYLNALQDSVSIEGKELKWGYALVGGEDEKWESGRKIDVVLGADLTYDGSGIPALVSTFGDLCNLNPEVKIIIAATVRNPKTFKGFLNACRNGGFRIQEIEFGVTRKREQEGPFYEDSVPIQLSLITKTSGGGNYGKG